MVFVLYIWICTFRCTYRSQNVTPHSSHNTHPITQEEQQTLSWHAKSWKNTVYCLPCTISTHTNLGLFCLFLFVVDSDFQNKSHTMHGTFLLSRYRRSEPEKPQKSPHSWKNIYFTQLFCHRVRDIYTWIYNDITLMSVLSRTPSSLFCNF